MQIRNSSLNQNFCNLAYQKLAAENKINLMEEENIMMIKELMLQIKHEVDLNYKYIN